ncbi:MAG: hypothetical protein ACRCZF_17435 [Gemmataceae bacterium]
MEPISAELRSKVSELAAACPPADGYRRHAVRATLPGGWHLNIPGSLAITWEDSRTWTAWDSTRSIWFRGTHLSAEGPEPAEALAAAAHTLPAGQPVVATAAPGVLHQATWGLHTEDGKTHWRLSGVASCSGRLGVCNIYVHAPDDRDWAIRIWESLQHDSIGGTTTRP